jgi:hypothetical protein
MHGAKMLPENWLVYMGDLIRDSHVRTNLGLQTDSGRLIGYIISGA